MNSVVCWRAVKN